MLNQRDEDIQEAIAILATLEQLAARDVPEADDLACVIRGLVRVGQYNQAKDKQARIMADEGKQAPKAKLAQLEAIREEARAQMAEQCEILHEKLSQNSQKGAGYVTVLYTLGVLYTQLKNEAKARSSFVNGSKHIQSVRELGQAAQAAQAALWLDLDAAVQCNLALADQYLTIGKITNALRSLDAVAALDKIQTVSYELYGLCMEKESAFEDAVRYYESAWLLSRGSPSVAYRLAYNYMKAAKYGDAVLMCQTALAEWPQFMRLRKEVLYAAEAHVRSVKGGK